MRGQREEFTVNSRIYSESWLWNCGTVVRQGFHFSFSCILFV